MLKLDINSNSPGLLGDAEGLVPRSLVCYENENFQPDYGSSDIRIPVSSNDTTPSPVSLHITRSSNGFPKASRRPPGRVDRPWRAIAPRPACPEPSTTFSPGGHRPSIGVRQPLYSPTTSRKPNSSYPVSRPAKSRVGRRTSATGPSSNGVGRGGLQRAKEGLAYHSYPR